jgi:preprotein translocase subunit SecF
MFELIRPGTKIDFMGKRHLWVSISVIAVLITVVLFFTKGLNYGIDFTGGAEIQLKVPQSWEISKLRDQLEKNGFHGAKVQQIGDVSEHQFLIKAQGDEASLNQMSQKIQTLLLQELKAGEFEIQKVDVVGPAAGSSLRQSGFLSMFYALICILMIPRFAALSIAT